MMTTKAMPPAQSEPGAFATPGRSRTTEKVPLTRAAPKSANSGRTLRPAGVSTSRPRCQLQRLNTQQSEQRTNGLPRTPLRDALPSRGIRVASVSGWELAQVRIEGFARVRGTDRPQVERERNAFHQLWIGRCMPFVQVEHLRLLLRSEFRLTSLERANRSSTVTTNVSRTDTAPSVSVSSCRGRSIPLSP